MKNKGTPREPRVRYHFKNAEMDFFLQWIQGTQTFGGAEGGECLYAASKIKDGNSESWVNEWISMAAKVYARGVESLNRNHFVSARESFLRAFVYHRASLLYVSPVLEPERYKQEYEQSQKFFRLAAKLMEPRLTVENIPFEDYQLPAYFQPNPKGIVAPTLIMLGGGDTFVEDLYPYIGPAAQRRNWNLLIADFPGQGILPYYGKTWRANAEKPMKVVIDHLLKKPEVNRNTIVCYGISAGGYLVTRTAAYEKRLAASAACSVITDLSGVWNRRFTDLWEKAEKYPIHKIIKKWVQIRHKAYVTMVDTYVWRMNAKTPQGLIPATSDCIVDTSLIDKPFLNINSEQELGSPIFTSFRKKLKAGAKNPLNKFVVMPANEGADTHAIGSNLSLMSQVVFDWFEEVLSNDYSFKKF